MNLRNSIIFIALVLMVVMISACTPRKSRTTTINPTSSNIPQAQVSSPSVTQNTPPGPLFGTPTIDPCDKLEYIADISIPDGMVLPAGASFTKTWQIKNTGSCIWNQNYSLIFLEGNAMGSEANVPLSDLTSVVPGAQAEVSVALQAPSIPGKYTGTWTLRSGRTGMTFEQRLTVNIEVVSMTVDPNSFASSVCSAQWQSNGSTISCFGSDSGGNASVSYSEAPIMEDGSEENEPSLVVTLSPGASSKVVGRFPPIFVSGGSYLRGVYSCYGNSPGCRVRMRITYQIEGGLETQIGEWSETFNNSFSRVDVDLSPYGLAGRNVTFTFYFEADGSGEQNKVFFLAPRLAAP